MKVAWLGWWLVVLPGGAQEVPPPAAWGPTPSARQLAWHRMEMYGFIHFSLNTFTDREWGGGDEDPALFRPAALDARQWARVAREGGLRGLILTAKHHDGFCLWPTATTGYSVKASPWREGRGDVVGELAAACRAEGLALGLYVSPWDRNHPEYGKSGYLAVYRAQLRELLAGYGPLFAVWFDGANGGTGWYGGAREERRIDRRSYYDWPETWALVRELQPGAVIFSDAGPDVRWVGNEDGRAPETCWAKVKPEGVWPGLADPRRLGPGDPDGTVWRPAEADVSIRPGWFYHAAQDGRVKGVEELLEIWQASVGRGCNLLLNLPPDRRGLIPEADAARLRGLKRRLDLAYGQDLARGRPATATAVRGGDPRYGPGRAVDGDGETYWAAGDEVRAAALEVDLGGPVRVDRIRLEEPIRLGQRLEAFAVDARAGGEWREVAAGTTVGPRRILSWAPVLADRIRIRILRSQACPALATVSLFLAPAA